MNNDKRWITVSEYVDIETGEIITKSLYEREYIIIRKTKKYEDSGNYNIAKWVNECRRHGQTKLWGDS